MKKQIILMICLVLLIGSVLAVDVTNVGDWWGTVKINGEYTNDAVVDAYINNIKVENAIVGAIQPNYYLIHVEGIEGNEIVFKVNGKEATTESWSNGDHELDLEVSISEVNTDTNVVNNDNSPGGGSPSGDSPSGDNPTITTDETTDTQTSTSEDEEDNGIDLDSNENQETTGSGVTGGVIGFVKSGVGIGLIFIFLILIVGIGVVMSRKKTPKK